MELYVLIKSSKSKVIKSVDASTFIERMRKMRALCEPRFLVGRKCYFRERLPFNRSANFFDES